MIPKISSKETKLTEIWLTKNVGFQAIAVEPSRTEIRRKADTRRFVTVGDFVPLRIVAHCCSLWHIEQLIMRGCSQVPDNAT